MKSSSAQLAYAASYRATHREEIASYGAAYKEAHREERRAYDAAYYQSHREGVLAYKASYYHDHEEEDRQDYTRFKEWLHIIRTVNGCADCGTHEGRLDHHHLDPATKTRNISEMYSSSLDALEEELEKCVVLCRPCHKNRHVASERGGAP